MKSRSNLLAAAVFAFEASASQTSRGVGSGLAFAPPSYATVVNPASVVSAPQAAISGAYQIRNENPFVGFVGGTGALGLGADYRKDGPRDETGTTSRKKEIVEASVGAKLLFLTLGGTVRKVKDAASNYDAAAMMDVGPFRLGGVVRDIRKGAQRIDTFLGMKVGHFYLEGNAKKPKLLASTSWLVDVGAAVVTSNFSMGAGYDASFVDSKISDGRVHAGVSYRLLENLFVDGMYRPFAQEWQAGEWLAALRAIF